MSGDPKHQTLDRPSTRFQCSGDHFAALERRLEDGYRRIEEARFQGVDVRAWEDFWLQLLHEYEDVCDQLTCRAA